MSSSKESASQARAFSTSRGTRFAYFWAPPVSDQATLLLIHGFPSHKDDWTNQQDFFLKRGYGVMAIDLPGFGDSIACDSEQGYSLKALSDELIELLDHEGVAANVVGIGHDIGTVVLSRLAAYHPQRVAAIVYLAVGPPKPAETFNLDMINQMTKEMLGFEFLGYIAWIARDPDAQHILQTHAPAAMKLMFCADGQVWNTKLRPLGAMRDFVSEDGDVQVGSWFSPELRKAHLQKYQKPSGYKGAVSWYKMMDGNACIQEEHAIAETKLEHATLLLVQEADRAQQTQMMEAWHVNSKVQSIAGGHWVHLESATETNAAIESFLATQSL